MQTSRGLLCTQDANIRTIAIHLELLTVVSGVDKTAACARFLLERNNSNIQELPRSSDITCICSCRTSVLSEACEHMQFVASNLFVCSEIRFILSIAVPLWESINEGNGWRGILIGKRIKSRNACWVTVNSVRGVRHTNFVPVFEGLGARRVSLPAIRRMVCTVCRRSAINRGMCEHGNAVAQAVKQLDESTENLEQHSASQGNARVRKYLSKLPRRIVPCSFETEAMFRMLDAVSKAQRSRTRIKNNQLDSNGFLSKKRI